MVPQIKVAHARTHTHTHTRTRTHTDHTHKRGARSVPSPPSSDLDYPIQAESVYQDKRAQQRNSVQQDTLQHTLPHTTTHSNTLQHTEEELAEQGDSAHHEQWPREAGAATHAHASISPHSFSEDKFLTSTRESARVRVRTRTRNGASVCGDLLGEEEQLGIAEQVGTSGEPARVLCSPPMSPKDPQTTIKEDSRRPSERFRCLFHMCDVTHLCVRHDSFVCVMWHIYVWDTTLSCVWHATFLCVTRLFHMCDHVCMFVRVYVCMCVCAYACMWWIRLVGSVKL